MVSEQAGPGVPAGYFTSGNGHFAVILDGSAGWALDPAQVDGSPSGASFKALYKAPWVGYVERLPAPAPLVGDSGRCTSPGGKRPVLWGRRQFSSGPGGCENLPLGLLMQSQGSGRILGKCERQSEPVGGGRRRDGQVRGLLILWI